MVSKNSYFLVSWSIVIDKFFITLEMALEKFWNYSFKIFVGKFVGVIFYYH